MRRLKITAFLSALLLLCSCSAGGISGKIPLDGTLSSKIKTVSNSFNEKDKDGYILAAKNDKFSLYYEETGLTVKVINNITGAVTTSAATPDEESSETWRNFVNSGIVLEYYKGEAVNINKINMYSGKPITKISMIENGFAAELNFKKIGISLTLFVTLNEDGIRAQVPYSSIKESNEQFRLAAIYIMPFLGYTRLGEVEGYMLIPDGSGAVISLKDNNEKFNQPYKAKVYGGNYSVESNTTTVQKYDDEIATTVDSAGVFAPVFGMVHTSTKNAFLGIIESGKYNAEIYAYPNGVITEYNWITARYVYREVYQYLTGQTGSISSTQKNAETFDISVVYRFEQGDEADYVGLAKSYRDYLIENKLINTKADTSYSTRIDFFAGDEEKALVGKSFVSMTSVDGIDNILGQLKNDGIDKLSVAIKGWQKKGIYGDITGKTTFQSDIGSFDDYKELAEKYSDTATFMLYGDFLNVYANSGSKEYIYQYNGRVFSNETFLKLHETKYRYTPESVKKRVDRLLEELEGTKNLGISFDGITNEVYSYEAGEKMTMFSRQYAAKAHSDILKSAGDKMNTAYTSPNDYTWQTINKYYDFRVYGSDYKFVAGEVPFFAIALNGTIPLYSEYVNFKADTTEYLLKLIESGVYPSFLLTQESPSKLIYTDSSSLFSCEYGEYKEMIAEYNKVFENLYSQIKGSRIADHSFDGGVAVTTYENGVKVIVNYNKQSVVSDGVTVDAQSYKTVNSKAVQ